MARADFIDFIDFGQPCKFPEWCSKCPNMARCHMDMELDDLTAEDETWTQLYSEGESLWT